MSIRFLTLASCTLLASCVSKSMAAVEHAAMSEIMRAVVPEAPGSEPIAPFDAEPQPRRSAPARDGIWGDRDFQRRLAESYIARSDVEPELTILELELIQKVLGIIGEVEGDGTKEYERALRLLARDYTELSSAVFDFTRANIYARQDRTEDAIASLRVAIEKKDTFLRAHENLGWFLFREERFEEALPHLTRALELGAVKNTVYGMLGYSHNSLGDPLAAESAFCQAILLDPQQSDWRQGLARALFDQRRYAEAASLAETLIQKHPERHELWLLQANAYLGLKEPMKAAENYELVDRLGHSTPQSLVTLADIYVSEGYFDIAAQRYLKAMLETQGAKDPKRFMQGARIMASQAAYQPAQDLLTGLTTHMALTEDEHFDVLKLKSRIALSAGMATQEQADDLEKIVELEPMDGEALILLGEHYGMREEGADAPRDRERAIFLFDRAAGIDENLEADAKLSHAQMLVREGEYGRALPLLRRVVGIRPDAAHIRDFLEKVEQADRRH